MAITETHYTANGDNLRFPYARSPSGGEVGWEPKHGVPFFGRVLAFSLMRGKKGRNRLFAVSETEKIPYSTEDLISYPVPASYIVNGHNFALMAPHPNPPPLERWHKERADYARSQHILQV
jgi:hypothetical protein